MPQTDDLVERSHTTTHITGLQNYNLQKTICMPGLSMRKLQNNFLTVYVWPMKYACFLWVHIIYIWPKVCIQLTAIFIFLYNLIQIINRITRFPSRCRCKQIKIKIQHIIGYTIFNFM